MISYKNLSGNSGVSMYEIGSDFIRVLFHGNSRIYTYSYRSTGMQHVEDMKILAQRGSGLNGYINQYCRYSYETR